MRIEKRGKTLKNHVKIEVLESEILNYDVLMNCDDLNCLDM